MRILRLNALPFIDFHSTFFSQNTCRMSASFSGYSRDGPYDSLTDHIKSSRKWVVVNHCRPAKEDIEFKMVSWNLLSRDLMQKHSYLYQNCSINSCNWSNRLPKILKYLFNSRKQYKIICLQELNYLDYENDFVPYTRDLGYESIYEKRGYNCEDGCAIFYHIDTFELDSFNIVHLGNPRVIVDSLKQRGNVAIIASFRPKSPRVKSDTEAALASGESKFIVATTHLLFNPKRGDIKICQLRLLLAELWKSVTFKTIDGSVTQWPLILCGDFNLQPNSPLHNFLIKRKMNPIGVRTGDLSGQFDGMGKGQFIENHHHVNLPALSSDSCYIDQEEESSSSTSSDNHLSDLQVKQNDFSNEQFSGFTHNFRFTPVYPSFHSTTGEPCASSSVQNDATLVDYILYTQKDSCHKMAAKLSLISYFDLPTQSQLKSYGPLPNFFIPSDHLPLEARFLFQPHVSK